MDERELIVLAMRQGGIVCVKFVWAEDFEDAAVQASLKWPAWTVGYACRLPGDVNDIVNEAWAMGEVVA